MLSVHSRATRHRGRSRRPNRYGAATRPPCGRNTTLQSSPISGCVQALVPSDSAFLSPIRSQDVQRGPFLVICGSHRRRCRVARSCTAATPPQISVLNRKRRRGRDGPTGHARREDRHSIDRRIAPVALRGCRRPSPPCVRTAPGCPPRDRTPASSALEDPKYCDVIVETWQRLTGKTTCPPGSLPSGKPTPGAGATGE